MGKMVDLLLTETVESLGIVGDVVSVRSGYARNFLSPSGLAMEPSEEAIQALAEKRELAERQQRERRSQREKLIEKLADYEITLQRSCNDSGSLYGSVSQADIAEAMQAEGFNVTARDVRLSAHIKRIDSYKVLIKLDQDLETEVKIWVVPDRELPTQEREEMEFDEDGELVSQNAKKEAEQTGETSKD